MTVEHPGMTAVYQAQRPPVQVRPVRRPPERLLQNESIDRKTKALIDSHMYSKFLRKDLCNCQTGLRLD